MDNQNLPIIVKGCNGSLTIQLDDVFAKKMSMLIEGINSKMTACKRKVKSNRFWKNNGNRFMQK